MRPIDADKLIDDINEKAKHLENEDTINGLCGAIAIIFDQPTINCDEVLETIRGIINYES